jgi:hypothetical protein
MPALDRKNAPKGSTNACFAANPPIAAFRCTSQEIRTEAALQTYDELNA